MGRGRGEFEVGEEGGGLRMEEIAVWIPPQDDHPGTHHSLT